EQIAARVHAVAGERLDRAAVVRRQVPLVARQHALPAFPAQCLQLFLAHRVGLAQLTAALDGLPRRLRRRRDRSATLVLGLPAGRSGTTLFRGVAPADVGLRAFLAGVGGFGVLGVRR